MVAIFSHPLQRRWRGANHHRVGRARIDRIAGRIGPTTYRRLSTLIITGCDDRGEGRHALGQRPACAGGRVLERVTTFSDRPPGAAFWYDNLNGLAEIAPNQGRADRELNLAIGIRLDILC